MVNRLLLSVFLGIAWLAPSGTGLPDGEGRLDATLGQRAANPRGSSRVIVQTAEGCLPDTFVARLGAKRARHLADGDVLIVPDRALDVLSRNRLVLSVRADRPVYDTASAEWTGAGRIAGISWARGTLGLDGTGVGIAMLDSGVTPWHDDLAGPGRAGQRVARFVDFVQGRLAPYDDYGHGTHVAGILAGNGSDSDGARAGIAPGAGLVALKVLDANGDGFVSDVIAAFDYAVAHRSELNIRVMNVSVAAAPTESYTTDPLTLAAKRAVDAGIVVVAAAGNMGRGGDGEPLFGGITAPGNAPWVLTVGASTRGPDSEGSEPAVAAFSSRGPTRFDADPKPDLVAPGVGLVSLSEPGSTLYEARPRMRRWGSVDTVAPPYFSMSGTSMAAPVVSGTIALMLQANPALTPNAVKGILEYTAEWREGWSTLEQGAGFLNVRGAVALSRRFGSGQTAADDDGSSSWSRHILWGDRHLDAPLPPPDAAVWATTTVWGAKYW